MIEYGIKNEKIKEAFEFLSKKIDLAYNDSYLFSNQVLSKNPFTNNFLRYFLDGVEKKVDNLLIGKKLFFYFVRNIAYYFTYTINFFVFKLFFNKNKNVLGGKECILVDTFFMVDKIADSGKFKDGYFLGLDDILKKYHKTYAYAPKFYGVHKFWRMPKVFKAIRDSQEPVFSEFQLLDIADMMKLFIFILKYPFVVISYCNSIKENDCNDSILRYALIDNLDEIAFISHARYLFGVNMNKIGATDVKVISWFENQAMDKNFFFGLRQSGIGCRIIGAQLFLYNHFYMCAMLDEVEMKFGVLPDKILVNGKNYLPNSNSMLFEIGPSLRYKKIFETYNKKKFNGRLNILVLLSFSDEHNMELISRLRFMSLEFDYKIMIKPHQDIDINRYSGLLDGIKNIEIVNDDIYKLFSGSDIVIGGSSGTLIEAITIGSFVLQMSVGGFEYKFLDRIADFGIVWDEFDSGLELKYKIQHLYNKLSANDEVGTSNIEFYMNFFSYPSEDLVLKTMELTA